MEKHGTRTAHGTPIGTSSEEEALEKMHESTILQRTEKGYVETPINEIPLSEQTGEGRLERAAGEEKEQKEEKGA